MEDSKKLGKDLAEVAHRQSSSGPPEKKRGKEARQELGEEQSEERKDVAGEPSKHVSYFIAFTLPMMTYIDVVAFSGTNKMAR